jgi:uncharacterized protein (TIGR02757 family)
MDGTRATTGGIGAFLEAAYARWHTLDEVARDPLSFPRRYPDPRDREVVGLLAASFAFGRVASLMASIERLLARLGPAPATLLAGLDVPGCVAVADGLRHRFVGPVETAGLLAAIGRRLRDDGGLEPAFLRGFLPEGDTVRGLAALAASLRSPGPGIPDPGFLVPVAGTASPAKRLNLFLRWMVRDDGIDLGLWRDVPTDRLLVPLDVHVCRIARRLGLLRERRSGPRMDDARDLAEALKAYDPADPVRFDFALSHLGITGRCVADGGAAPCDRCDLRGACALGAA